MNMTGNKVMYMGYVLYEPESIQLDDGRRVFVVRMSGHPISSKQLDVRNVFFLDAAPFDTYYDMLDRVHPFTYVVVDGDEIIEDNQTPEWLKLNYNSATPGNAIWTDRWYVLPDDEIEDPALRMPKDLSNALI